MMIGAITFGIGVYIIIGFLMFKPFLDYIEEGLTIQEKRMTKLRVLKVLFMQALWPITLAGLIFISLYSWWTAMPDE